MLDTVDLAAPFDLDRDGAAVDIAAQQVDRTDVGRILAPHETQPVGDDGGVGGEQHLEMGFDAVFLQTGIGAEVVADVGQHFEDGDGDLVFAVGDDPHVVVDSQLIGRVHPVERLVRAAVGVDGDATVGLDHDEAHRLGQVRVEPALVVDGAASDDEAHPANLPATSPAVPSPCARG